MASQKDYLISYPTSKTSVTSVRVTASSPKAAKSQGAESLKDHLGKVIDLDKIEVTQFGSNE